MSTYRFGPSRSAGRCDRRMFGGPHPGGISVAIADGSVRSVSWNVPGAVFQLIARKNDGLTVDVDSF